MTSSCKNGWSSEAFELKLKLSLKMGLHRRLLGNVFSFCWILATGIDALYPHAVLRH